jgi:hypothetical protein
MLLSGVTIVYHNHDARTLQDTLNGSIEGNDMNDGIGSDAVNEAWIDHFFDFDTYVANESGGDDKQLTTTPRSPVYQLYSRFHDYPAIRTPKLSRPIPHS